MDIQIFPPFHLLSQAFIFPPRGGGGGSTQVQRAAAPALRISQKKGSFIRPPHVRDFVKEGYFFGQKSVF